MSDQQEHLKTEIKILKLLSEALKAEAFGEKRAARIAVNELQVKLTEKLEPQVPNFEYPRDYKIERIIARKVMNYIAARLSRHGKDVLLTDSMYDKITELVSTICDLKLYQQI